MESRDSQSENPEVPFNRKEGLAPIEHILIGSSTSYKGKLFVSQTFREEVHRLGKIPEEMLIPAGIVQDRSKFGEIKKTREKSIPVAGMLNFLSNSQIDLSLEEGVSPGIEFGPLDESGRVVPSWKIFLVNSAGEIDSSPKHIKEVLSLDEKFDDFFELAPNKEEDALYLNIKPEYRP